MQKHLVYLFLFFLIPGTYFSFGQAVKLPELKHKLIVVAHRGDHTEAPENTLTAFRKAINHGVDYVEIDLRTSKDGELVIMHDASIHRMTNGEGTVKEKTLAELKQLVVADKAHPEWAKESIPTFAEVLQLCKGKIYIYLDFKDASVPATIVLLKKYRMEKSVVVYINTEEQYREWKRLVPDMPLMLSLPDNVKNAQGVSEFLSTTEVDILDGSYEDYTPEMVKAAMAKNVPVCPDIQSTHEGPEEWGSALSKGFKGLQTDHPKLLIAYLKKEGLR